MFTSQVDLIKVKHFPCTFFLRISLTISFKSVEFPLRKFYYLFLNYHTKVKGYTVGAKSHWNSRIWMAKMTCCHLSWQNSTQHDASQIHVAPPKSLDLWVPVMFPINTSEVPTLPAWPCSSELCPKSTGRLLTNTRVWGHQRWEGLSTLQVPQLLLKYFFLMKLAKNKMKSKINSHVSELGIISWCVWVCCVWQGCTGGLYNSRIQGGKWSLYESFCSIVTTMALKGCCRRKWAVGTYFFSYTCAKFFFFTIRAVSRLEFRNLCLNKAKYKAIADQSKIQSNCRWMKNKNIYGMKDYLEMRMLCKTKSSTQLRCLWIASTARMAQ